MVSWKADFPASSVTGHIEEYSGALEQVEERIVATSNGIATVPASNCHVDESDSHRLFIPLWHRSEWQWQSYPVWKSTALKLDNKNNINLKSGKGDGEIEKKAF